MATDLALAFCAILICEVLFLVYKSMARPANFPPGPRGVPFLGCLHYLKTFPERDMLELSKTYGDVFSLKFGSKDFVCVCGFEANKEALRHEALCGRRVVHLFRLAKGDAPCGIAHNDFNPVFNANRRVLEKYVTEKVAAENSPEKVVMREISKLMTELESLVDPIPVPAVVESLAFDIILGYVFGSNVNPTEEEKVERSELLRAVSALPRLYLEKATELPELFPILEKIWLPGPSRKFRDASKLILNYVNKQLNTHKGTIDGENPRDYLDWYLRNIQLEKQQSKDSESILTERDFMMGVYDIFIASFDSPANSVAFAILYLSGNPKVQEKLYEEIEMTSRKRNVPWEDRDKMPYTLATTYEVLRFSNLTPNGVPRKARTDLTFKGYSIPKGTVFLLNSYSVHFQEDQWKNAKEFDPENFLTEEGKFQDNEAFQAFGDGPRKCPGHSLAKQILFTFLFSFVRKFKVEPESDAKPPDFDPLPGLVPKPKPQNVRLLKRNIRLKRCLDCQ